MLIKMWWHTNADSCLAGSDKHEVGLFAEMLLKCSICVVLFLLGDGEARTAFGLCKVLTNLSFVL